VEQHQAQQHLQNVQVYIVEQRGTLWMLERLVPMRMTQLIVLTWMHYIYYGKLQLLVQLIILTITSV
jgi:hypothetical protein